MHPVNPAIHNVREQKTEDRDQKMSPELPNLFDCFSVEEDRLLIPVFWLLSSAAPSARMVEPAGIEPATSSLQS